MTALVCGGRDYCDVTALFAVLREVAPDTIIQGGARGADGMAKAWAEQNSIPCTTFHADWKRHGPAAGPIRNTRMLEEGKPDICIACPGGRGTADMVEKCERAGIPVRRIS